MKIYAFCFVSLLLCVLSGTDVLGDEPKEIPHPPTFAHIQYAKSLLYHDDYTDEDFSYTLQLEEALQYTPDEVQKLLQHGDIDYLLGVAHTAPYGESPKFLHQHYGRIQHHKAALSLYLTMTLLQEPAPLPYNIEALLQHFRRIDEQNSFPYYLTAYYFAIRHDIPRCYEWLVKGNALEHFTDYFHELCRASIKTSEFLGYSPFVARYRALSQHDWFLFGQLTNQIIASAAQHPKILEEGVTLGMRLQTFRSTHMLELAGLSLREKVVERMDLPESSKQETLQQIQVERQTIQDLMEQFYEVQERSIIPEQRWVQYFEDMYTHSERMAMNALITEYEN
jgi:hypothetical protein